MDNSANVLIVDDVPDNIQVAMNFLKEEPYNLSFATRGQEAHALMKTHEYDLILLDIMMPEMDGPQTLQNIRSMPNGESVPAVFMTARVQVHERESYMQLGAVGVIPKPFDPMTLSDQIAEMWRLSSAAACQDS